MAKYSYAVKPDYSQRKPFVEAVNNHFDMGDRLTRDSLTGLHEEDQSKVLMALTTKLYDQIMNKVDDIDYGEIPRTKGNIMKLSNYENMRECIQVITDLFKEYKQDTAPIDNIRDALDNLCKRSDVFQKAFMVKAEFPIVIYDTIALSIVESLSLMISTCIEFIKSPTDDCVDMILNNVAVAKTYRHLLFDNLKKFNNSCKSGDLDKGIEFMLNNTKNNFLGGVGVMAGAIVGLGIIMNIIPILRELIYFYYHSRVRFSDYLSIQADLLQINAYNVEHNKSIAADERKHITTRQLKVVDSLRKISNAVAIDSATAEKKATIEITNDNKKKYKADEVMDTMPDSASGSIF